VRTSQHTVQIGDDTSYSAIISRDIVSGEILWFKDTGSVLDSLRTKKIMRRKTQDIVSFHSLSGKGFAKPLSGILLSAEETISDTLSHSRAFSRILKDKESMIARRSEHLDVERSLSDTESIEDTLIIPRRIVANISTTVGVKDKAN